MALSAWALYLSVAVAILAASLLHYRRHEPAGRGRYVLATLRGASLALLVLLAFDPVLPAWRTVGPPTVALVDASLSMRLPAADGTTPWEAARREVAALGPDRVLTFGAGESRPEASLDQARPDRPASRLAPGLRSVLEAGAGRVVVITDGRVEDVTEVQRLVRDHPGRVELRRVGAATAGNIGMVELDAPGWARTGEEVEVGVGIARLGDPVPDSATVVLRVGAAEVARARLPTPAEGSVATATLRFTPRSGADGPVRLDASVEEADVEPADDRRSVYMVVAEAAAGLALVSFVPDQEPRFLLPVLERAVGIPAAGWLAPAPGRYVRLGAGREAGTSADEAAVRRAVAEADLVVLHGLDENAPTWARSAAATAERVLLFPRATVNAVPLALEPRRPGDWYPAADVPPSPVAALVSAAEPGRAPPLTAVRGARAPGGWWSPLDVLHERRGTAYPVLLAGRSGERRVAVALADGYWRWAFADGHGRALYEALWAGVAGWLMEEAGTRVHDAVRPAAPVVPRGEPLRWVVPLDADSVRVSLQPLDDGTPTEAVLVAVDGSAVQTPQGPGHYRYEARAFVAAGAPAVGVGELTVERYSPEFTRPARALDLGDGDGTAMVGEPGTGRPLRATPWPWTAVVLLLCAEWVLRRRWGLR